MNDYFCSIGEKRSSNIPSTEDPLLNGNYSINDSCARFHFQMIRPEELRRIGSTFKTSQNYGFDGITSLFIKIGMPVIAPSLCCIFNTSIS